MKKIQNILSAALLLSVSLNLQAQEDAVRSFADKVAASRVSFSYTYVMDDGDVALNGTGSIVTQGDCYHMEGDGLEIWCDGKSVCTLDKSAGEVVFEPVWAGSGAFVNPAALVSNVDREFTWSSGKSGTFKGRPVLQYELAPATASGDIEGMELFFSEDGKTLYGAELETSKVNLVFTFSSFSFERPGEASEFMAPDFGPEYFVTDLR